MKFPDVRSKFWFIGVLLIPGLLFVNVRQAYRFDRLRREIARTRQEQNALFESNKRAIAGISSLSSPARISRIAEQELSLRRFESRDIITVVVRPGNRNE